MVQAIAVVASLLLLAIVLPGCTPLAATSAVAAPQQQQQQQQSQRRTWHARDIGDAAAAAAADAATAANIVARRSLAETAVPASTTLGFLFPLTNHAAGAARAAAAMVVTEAINAGDDTFLAGIKLSEVLPNTTLEFVLFDTEARPTTGVRVALDAMLPEADQEPAVGLVGATSSSVSSPIAFLTPVFEVPQISYASTAETLSDKRRAPYFLRTLPPDSQQTVALAAIVLKYGWTDVIVISSDEAYGEGLGAGFQEQAQRVNIRIAAALKFSGGLSKDVVEDELAVVRQVIQGSGVRVIVLTAGLNDAAQVLLWAYTNGFVGTDFVWIAPDSVMIGTLFDVDVEGYTKAQSQAAFKGLIGTAPAQQGPHYTQWVDEIWHHLNYSSPMFDILVVNGTQTLPEIVFDIEPDNKVPFVVDAVLTFALALNKFYNNRATSTKTLLQYLLETEFQGLSGDVSFDANGDPLSKYNVVNYITPELGERTVAVFSTTTGYEDITDIVWASGSTTVPSGKAGAIHVVIRERPAVVSASASPSFVFECRNSSNVPIEGCAFSFRINNEPVVKLNCSQSTVRTTAAQCATTLFLEKQGTFSITVSAASQFGLRSERDPTYAWQHRLCGENFYNDIDPVTGLLTCERCPMGADCVNSTTTRENMVALPGWWTGNNGTTFHACPIANSCEGGLVSGDRVIRARCNTGYQGLVCAVCTDGFANQFGFCNACPTHELSWLLVVGVLTALVVVVAVGFKFRALLPRPELRVSLAFAQVVGSAVTVYTVVWPRTLGVVLDTLTFFLLDIVRFSRFSCAVPISYYESLRTQLFTFKIVFVIIALLLICEKWVRACKHERKRRKAQEEGGEALPSTKEITAKKRRSSVISWARQSAASTASTASLAAVTTTPGGTNWREKAAGMKEQALNGWGCFNLCGRCTSRAFDASLTCLHHTFPNGHWDLLRDINWAHVKRMMWLYLTVCYPGISIKVMRAFVCQDIDGTMYLKADYRLQCYTSAWWGNAVYAIVVSVAYVVGYPLMVIALLLSHRKTLNFEASFVAVGFLYDLYEPHAFMYMVAELLRRLVLCCLVVFINTEHQLMVAVIVSVMAHAFYAGYGAYHSRTAHCLQHLSLFTSFTVFLAGLLLVNKAPGAETLSNMAGVMVVVYVVTAACTMAYRIRHNYQNIKRRGRSGHTHRTYGRSKRTKRRVTMREVSFENPMRKAASAASASAVGSPRSSSMPRQTLQLGNGVVELPSMASRVGAASVNGHRQTAHTNGGVGAGAGAARAHGSSSGSSSIPGRRKGRRHSSYTASPRSRVRGSGGDTALAASSPLANEAGAATAESSSPSPSPPPLAGRSTGIGAIGKNLTQSPSSKGIQTPNGTVFI